MDFCSVLLQKAKECSYKVVLPESNDERILKAAHILLKNGGAKIILLGKKDKILTQSLKLGLDLQQANIIDNENNEFIDEFANTLYELRKNKGLSLEEAKKLIITKEYFGTMLVFKGLAHAMVSGANTTTATTIKPALQFVKMKEGIQCISGAFIMVLKDKIWFFADCAITPSPSSDELAGIAIATANTAQNFGIEPKVAFLSYATGNSASGQMIEFVKESVKKTQNLAPHLCIDGPMQFDAAVSNEVAKLKMPESNVAGNANVFIFPDLNCANITYKAVQRVSDALAIGPILQGLKKPINDLSRGCSVDDVVNTILVSVLQD